MQNNQQVIIDMQKELSRLKSDLDSLSSQYYKNNFSSRQDFNKACSFSNKLKVPSYTTLPTCEIGEICESSGKLYICSATDTWTIVGTQS